MTTLPPLLLEPLLVPKPWGGRRLGDLGRALPDGVDIGESWDLADLDAEMTPVPDPVSRIVGGAMAGRSLREVVADSAAALLGRDHAEARRFPLLVKHLDAREHLSVQVHPPAEQVARHPGIHLKTESWVVIAAEPGAGLFLGVRPGVTLDQIEAAMGTSALPGLLGWVPARVGDVHHVPAGLIHAVGAGVLVAEVQTPSDTTFRLYDWVDEYGRAPRELQVELGLEAIRSQWALNVDPPATVSNEGLLVDTDHYTISRQRAEASRTVRVEPRPVARVVLVMSGQVRIAGLDAPVGPGRLAVLPADWAGDLAAEADSSWLDIDLVAPRRVGRRA
ncbi:type I phosphomannose isomerase catalytic subunit [Actinotalea sp.]|uniref:type I phosphomannose isomerase catalytic subunit n=1 Tax=Actinotalea sp. TaxID=1872145 RepID=UPI00356A8DCF